MMCLCLKDSFDSNYRALQYMSGNQIMLILDMFRLLKSHISQAYMIQIHGHWYFVQEG